METKSITQGINEIKSWLFEKINNIDKSLAKPTKKKGGRRQGRKTGRVARACNPRILEGGRDRIDHGLSLVCA
jgi:hypothetical protein